LCQESSRVRSIKVKAKLTLELWLSDDHRRALFKAGDHVVLRAQVALREGEFGEKSVNRGKVVSFVASVLDLLFDFG